MEYIRHLALTSDWTHVVCATNQGFQIFRLLPSVKTVCVCAQLQEHGGVERADLSLAKWFVLYTQPKFKNRVFLWSVSQGKLQGEYRLMDEVLNVKCSTRCFAFITMDVTYVYDTMTCDQIAQISTGPNIAGICALCPSQLLVCTPGNAEGHLFLDFLDEAKQITIRAHQSRVAMCALSNDGSHVVSASQRGTVLRVFECEQGDLLYELKRGLFPADIYCLFFHPSNANVLFASSATGTVHVYNLENKQLCYWTQRGISSGKFRVHANIPNVLGFNVQQNVLIVVNFDGSVVLLSCQDNQLAHKNSFRVALQKT